MEDMHREMDACLGEAIRKADAGTLLLVVSDHGFGSFRRQVHLNRWLVDNGYMRVKGSPDAEGRGLFLDVDWNNTRAYAVGFSSIYLNLEGREGNGIVRRGEQSAGLLDEIGSKMQTLADPETGTRAIHKVYVGPRIYADGPLVNDAPDLVVGFEPGYRASWQTALGGAPLPMVEDNKTRWSGDHIFDPSFMPGVLFSNVKLPAGTYRGIDVAPTILAGLGLDRPGIMTGKDLLRPDTAA
jgi:predicted AlkP superfamily phosphohydrolase/phosphomutase